MECYCYLRNVQDLLSDGTTLTNGAWENHSVGQQHPFGSMVGHHPISAEDQVRLHHFGEKLLLGVFLGDALYAGGIWQGGILVADVQELSILDTSEIHARRLSARKVLMPKNGE